MRERIVSLKCQKCGDKSETTMAILRGFSYLWRCGRCGTGQAYVREPGPVEVDVPKAEKAPKAQGETYLDRW